MKTGYTVLGIGIIALLILLSCTACVGYMNEQTIECTVKDKWVKNYSSDSEYLVSCDDTVYKISDLMFKGKFNSSDIYARLEIGKRYKMKITGYRLPYFSEYQNINEIEEIGDK